MSTMTTTAPGTRPSGGSRSTAARMPAEQRRAEILRAARHVFATRGLAATTDDVARAAGVSQPYVVRLFGSKQELVLEAYRAAAAEITAAFEAVPAGPDASYAMGEAYVRLLADRDLLVLVMQGFIADPGSAVGDVARATLGEAFRLFRERTGLGDDEARTFVAQGMLINVLVATDAMSHRGDHPGLDGLVECTMDVEALLGRAQGTRRPVVDAG